MLNKRPKFFGTENEKTPGGGGLPGFFHTATGGLYTSASYSEGYDFNTKMHALSRTMVIAPTRPLMLVVVNVITLLFR